MRTMAMTLLLLALSNYGFAQTEPRIDIISEDLVLPEQISIDISSNKKFSKLESMFFNSTEKIFLEDVRAKEDGKGVVRCYYVNRFDQKQNLGTFNLTVLFPSDLKKTKLQGSTIVGSTIMSSKESIISDLDSSDFYDDFFTYDVDKNNYIVADQDRWFSGLPSYSNSLVFKRDKKGVILFIMKIARGPLDLVFEENNKITAAGYCL